MEDIILQFKDKIESMVINNHMENKEYFQDKASELREMLQSIKEKNIKEAFEKSIINIEKAIELLKENRDRIILEEFDRTREIVFGIFSKTLDEFQVKLEKTNISDFNIISKNEFDLVLAGSFDFSYYHDVEVIFSDVHFILCPGYQFCIDKFRLATKDEINGLNKFMNGYEKYGIVTCLEDSFSGGKYYIVAEQIKCNWGTVFYYDRENLQPGERIADWVRKESR